MKTTKGNPRVLTDAQIQRILVRHARLQAWQKRRAQIPTLRAFARAHGIDQKSLLRLLPKLDAKIEFLLHVRAWYHEERELLASREQIDTLRGLAREFGVSTTTIGVVVRHNGEYKQVSPELRAATRIERRTHLDRLRRLGLY